MTSPAPGSDRLVDSLIVYGTPETIAARLTEHIDAGADHVPIQLLTSPAKVIPPTLATSPVHSGWADRKKDNR